MFEDTGQKYPCPCCGYLVFTTQPGSYQTCPICLWQDNLAQLRFPLMPGAANTVSLERGQQNFVACQAAEKRNSGLTRAPIEAERRDPLWRPLDPSQDNIEEPQRGIDYADSYPIQDTTVLYYWRDTYWRRYSS
ncbi:MAG: hydrolase [Chromatiales bacterium]|nr:hydrolase [Chromatiales bacterium]